MSTPRPARRVVIVAYPAVQSLDVCGPLEVFDGANQLIEAAGGHDPRYEIRIASPDGAPLSCSSGLQLAAHAAIRDVGFDIDTLIVAGGRGHRAAIHDTMLIDWLRAAQRRARRTASVCTGAFLLARAGLLDGRRATTHWAFTGRLAHEYPAITVEPDPIFLRDGPIWTSAGVTAGMDLALALVEDDLGSDAALTIARHLVLFLRRPGNQSQFSAALAAREPAREPLREVQRLVIEEPAATHTVEAMAARAGMSPRHFARAFRAETGVTPARYVERVRLEAARARLEDSGQPIAAVAAACGFGTAETMRRSFLRALDVGPAEYRRRFHADTDRRHAAA